MQDGDLDSDYDRLCTHLWYWQRGRGLRWPSGEKRDDQLGGRGGCGPAPTGEKRKHQLWEEEDVGRRQGRRGTDVGGRSRSLVAPAAGR